jgi:hypothetical protein
MFRLRETHIAVDFPIGSGTDGNEGMTGARQFT